MAGGHGAALATALPMVIHRGGRRERMPGKGRQRALAEFDEPGAFAHSANLLRRSSIERTRPVLARPNRHAFSNAERPERSGGPEQGPRRNRVRPRHAARSSGEGFLDVGAVLVLLLLCATLGVPELSGSAGTALPLSAATARVPDRRVVPESSPPVKCGIRPIETRPARWLP